MLIIQFLERQCTFCDDPIFLMIKVNYIFYEVRTSWHTEDKTKFYSVFQLIVKFTVLILSKHNEFDDQFLVLIISTKNWWSHSIWQRVRPTVFSQPFVVRKYRIFFNSPQLCNTIPIPIKKLKEILKITYRVQTKKSKHDRLFCCYKVLLWYE